MAERTIPLNCPACGSTSNEGLRDRAFGGEIKCKHCGVTSVLVIDNQWHQKKTGEYVCITCGRIARESDRFCECSRPLSRACLMCHTEFFIGKNVCPKCGWNHAQDISNPQLQAEIARNLWNLVQNDRFDEAGKEFGHLGKAIKSSQRITNEAELVLKKALIFFREEIHKRGPGFYQTLFPRMLHRFQTYVIGDFSSRDCTRDPQVLEYGDHSTVKVMASFGNWLLRMDNLYKISGSENPLEGLDCRLKAAKGVAPRIVEYPDALVWWSCFLGFIIGLSSGDGIFGRIGLAIGFAIGFCMLSFIASCIIANSMRSADKSAKCDELKSDALRLKREQDDARQQLKAEIEKVKCLPL